MSMCKHYTIESHSKKKKHFVSFFLFFLTARSLRVKNDPNFNSQQVNKMFIHLNIPHMFLIGNITT
jgi:hypothetical protein